MITAAYREGEIQALIVLIELADPIETPNNNFYTFYPRDAQEARKYFRRFALDLSGGFEMLAEKRLVHRKDGAWLLTQVGKEIAEKVRRARPPIWYFYQDFYTAIEHSKAFSQYCERVFGKDLGQHGFSDLDQIHRMLKLVNIGGGSRVLDIGCGNGKIAEYISDLTQASVTGLDYAPAAITQAVRRTEDKRERLRFLVGNIDDLDLADESFDVIVSIESIFFGQSLDDTVGKLKALLAPEGQMVIFCGEDLVSALEQKGLSYDVYDVSRENYEHCRLKYSVVCDLKEAFEAESNAFIWENLRAESERSAIPYDQAAHLYERYLYHVRT
jgi:2-polyprenyl-3-methyl-5-hydroxy-6-metoxy-1,4-benzoquinol methylase